MATLNSAWSSTLSVVDKTATTINNTVDTVDTTFAMLNDYARNARRHQKLSNAGREVGFKRRLAAEIAREQATLELELANWVVTDPQLAALFRENLALVDAAIEAAEATL